MFLRAFFWICPPCPYQNLSIWPKTHPLIFRYVNRPYKYVFFHAFFLICPPCPFQNLSIWPKTYPFIFRYENRPYKYVFLHAFFLICPPCPFQNLSIWPKTHPFFSNFARFRTPKRCTRVHCLVLKNNPNYFFFGGDDIQPKIQVPPPQGTQVGSQNVLTLTVASSRPMRSWQ